MVQRGICLGKGLVVQNVHDKTSAGIIKAGRQARGGFLLCA